MFSRKLSVATVDYPIHNVALPQEFRDARRHSAAPFSLSTRLPTADTKYATFGTSLHSTTLSSQEPHSITVEDTGYERAFFARMGRKLSTFLPKGAPTEHQASPVLRIKMRKEVHVATEEAARDMGSSENEGPLLRKPPYLRKMPSDDILHRSPIHDSSVSLTPATSPGSIADRRSRRKPVPLSLAEISYRTTTNIEQSYSSCSEQPLFQAPARSCSAVLKGVMGPEHSSRSLGHEDTPAKQIDVVRGANKAPTSLPPPIPPRSPRRTQYVPHYQASPLKDTLSTVVVPIKPAQMRSFGTVLKSLFGGRAGNGKMSYSKKNVIIVARKASLKRKKGKATHSPCQPYSARAVARPPVHTPSDIRRESPGFSRPFSVNRTRKLSRKRKSSLPSFLSIDSFDSRT